MRLIRWSQQGTVDNIAFASDHLDTPLHVLEEGTGLFGCDLVEAGKFRNGAARWWCRTHNEYWGRKSELQLADRSGQPACRLSCQPMAYVIDPFILNPSDFEELTIECLLPPAMSSHRAHANSTLIRVRAIQTGTQAGRRALVTDAEHRALAVLIDFPPPPSPSLLAAPDITRLHLTPPAALAFVLARERGQALTCIACRRCGYPHLDLGAFACKEHKRHYCGNCGHDGTHGAGPAISSPLLVLHEQTSSGTPEPALGEIDLDRYANCEVELRASLPAIVWKVSRPQPIGITVQIWRHGRRIIDESFAKVRYAGQLLDRRQLLEKMRAC